MEGCHCFCLVARRLFSALFWNFSEGCVPACLELCYEAMCQLEEARTALWQRSI